MHEESDVPYTQNTAPEYDCYREITGCDIVVCIIGAHFGSKSINNDLSITMNEIERAIKERKKVYVFIVNEIYVENDTFLHNQDNDQFRSAYVDDLRIHEFIGHLKERGRKAVIESFNNTDDIIIALKKQFAGLFQGLLHKEASLAEQKTTYDLQQSADQIASIIKEFRREKDELVNRFDSTIYSLNRTLYAIKEYLGLKQASFFAKDIDALDEIMALFGFNSVEVDNPNEDIRKYEVSEPVYRTYGYGTAPSYEPTRTLILKKPLFDSAGGFVNIKSMEKTKSLIIYRENKKQGHIEDDDGDLPF